MPINSHDPFAASALVQTRDVGEMQHTMRSVYGAAAFDADPSPEFEARSSFVRLDGIGIGFCGYDARATARFHEGDFARVQMALAGGATTTIGNEAIALDSARLCVSSPGRASTIAFEPGLRQLFVRVSRDNLDNAAGALLGARPRRALVFDGSAPVETPRAQLMRELVLFVGQRLLPAAPAMPALQQRELASFVAVSFLTAFRNSLSDLLDADGRAASLHHVQLVEEYVEAHWDEPITVDRLAALTTVSVRSLYLAFQRSRGYSPKAFVKQVRLRKARERLTDPASDSVMSIALACGFQNLGHFARDYRGLYGETPSVTLARARRQAARG